MMMKGASAVHKRFLISMDAGMDAVFGASNPVDMPVDDRVSNMNNFP